MAAKTWFSVRLLFVSEIQGADNQDRLCEESIILVQERDEAEAKKAAERFASAMRQEYANEQGETVKWRFIGVLEVQDLCEAKIVNGAEVWSRLFYESQARDTDILQSLDRTAAAQR